MAWACSFANPCSSHEQPFPTRTVPAMSARAFLTLFATSQLLWGCVRSSETAASVAAEARQFFRPAEPPPAEPPPAEPAWVTALPEYTRKYVRWLSPNEREKYAAYLAELEAAGEDEAAGWAAAERYVAVAAPNFLRDNMMENLAARADQDGRVEEALAWSRKLQAEGRVESRRFAAVGAEIRTLLRAGRRDEARRLIYAIPQHGVGGVDTDQKVIHASSRSDYLLSLGELDAARLSFLSQSPPGGDEEVLDFYLGVGEGLAYSLGARDPAAGLAFRQSLLDRYPAAATPTFLQHLAAEARAAGKTELREETLNRMRQEYPAADETAEAFGAAATEAVRAGDKEAARRYLNALLDHPDPGRWRDWAGRERRRIDPLFASDLDPDPPRGGGNDGGDGLNGLTPLPDPAFPKPAAGGGG